jgi:tRNA(adenine34) deaminase
VAREEIDDHFMGRCLGLAQESLELGETPVGSIVVRGEEILGEGREASRARFDPSAHAEVEAVRAACAKERSLGLPGCTLYTTVEPCVLCAYAIRRAGIARVVYGIPAGQAGGITSRYAILSDSDLKGWPSPPEIRGGVRAAECLEMLKRPSC